MWPVCHLSNIDGLLSGAGVGGPVNRTVVATGDRRGSLDRIHRRRAVFDELVRFESGRSRLTAGARTVVPHCRPVPVLFGLGVSVLAFACSDGQSLH